MSISVSVGVGLTAIRGSRSAPRAPEIVAVLVQPSPLRVGDTASAAVTWTGSPRTGVSYQWTLDGVDIPGATGATYVAAATGALSVRVSIDNGVAPPAGPVTSATVTVLPALAAPVFSVESASSIAGRNITVTTGTATGNPAPSYFIAATLDGSPVAMTGSGPWAFAVPSSSSAQTFAWTVTATNSQGADTSGGTRNVAADLSAPTVTAADGLSGRTLTISVTGSTGNPAPTFALTALTLNGADVLANVTGAGPWEYVVPSSVSAQTVAWTVTATNAAGVATASGSEVVAADLSAPTAAGNLSDITIAEDVAMTPVDVSSDFSGTSPITFALAPLSAALPAGLSLSSAGVISGTPTTASAGRSIVVRGTNAYGFADSAFTFTVTETVGTPWTPEAAFTSGVAYDATLADTVTVDGSGDITEITPRYPTTDGVSLLPLANGPLPVAYDAVNNLVVTTGTDNAIRGLNAVSVTRETGVTIVLVMQTSSVTSRLMFLGEGTGSTNRAILYGNSVFGLSSGAATNGAWLGASDRPIIMVVRADPIDGGTVQITGRVNGEVTLTGTLTPDNAYIGGANPVGTIRFDSYLVTDPLTYDWQFAAFLPYAASDDTLERLEGWAVRNLSLVSGVTLPVDHPWRDTVAYPVVPLGLPDVTFSWLADGVTETASEPDGATIAGTDTALAGSIAVTTVPGTAYDVTVSATNVSGLAPYSYTRDTTFAASGMGLIAWAANEQTGFSSDVNYTTTKGEWAGAAPAVGETTEISWRFVATAETTYIGIETAGGTGAAAAVKVNVTLTPRVETPVSVSASRSEIIEGPFRVAFSAPQTAGRYPVNGSWVVAGTPVEVTAFEPEARLQAIALDDGNVVTAQASPDWRTAGLVDMDFSINGTVEGSMIQTVQSTGVNTRTQGVNTYLENSGTRTIPSAALNVDPAKTGSPISVSTGSIVIKAQAALYRGRPDRYTAMIGVASAPAATAFRPPAITVNETTPPTILTSDVVLPTPILTPPAVETVLDGVGFDRTLDFVKTLALQHNVLPQSSNITPASNDPAAYTRSTSLNFAFVSAGIMFDHWSEAQRRTLAEHVVQYAIDVAGMAYSDNLRDWRSGGGSEGVHLPMLTLGALLTDNDWLWAAATWLPEDDQLRLTTAGTTRPAWRGIYGRGDGVTIGGYPIGGARFSEAFNKQRVPTGVTGWTDRAVGLVAISRTLFDGSYDDDATNIQRTGLFPFQARMVRYGDNDRTLNAANSTQMLPAWNVSAWLRDDLSTSSPETGTDGVFKHQLRSSAASIAYGTINSAPTLATLAAIRAYMIRETVTIPAWFQQLFDGSVNYALGLEFARATASVSTSSETEWTPEVRTLFAALIEATGEPVALHLRGAKVFASPYSNAKSVGSTMAVFAERPLWVGMTETTTASPWLDLTAQEFGGAIPEYIAAGTLPTEYRLATGTRNLGDGVTTVNTLPAGMALVTTGEHAGKITGTPTTSAPLQLVDIEARVGSGPWWPITVAVEVQAAPAVFNLFGRRVGLSNPYITTSITGRIETRGTAGGTLHYVLLPIQSDQPTAAQVIAGTNAADGAPVTAGTRAITGDGPHEWLMVGLSVNTAYDLYVVVTSPEGTSRLSGCRVKTWASNGSLGASPEPVAEANTTGPGPDPAATAFSTGFSEGFA